MVTNDKEEVDFGVENMNIKRFVFKVLPRRRKRRKAEELQTEKPISHKCMKPQLAFRFAKFVDDVVNN